ncbi:MAG: NAD(P)-dependent oxidoreductase [Anaerolineaceae bacterium]|nr:MAG: NAD(P)-dependent oxidoreductase [Anaerolineaceae bacterium]
MKILLTGAFGNIGTSTLEELIKRGHHVTCFDIKTKANENVAQNLNGKAEILWGDLRVRRDVAAAVRDQDAVVHLAFVIPRLSATGISSEDDPQWAKDINVGGTCNLIEGIKAQPHPPKILFSSSLHVYGKTQHLPPPRNINDIPQPIEHYAKHKVECEELIKDSGLDWTIFRLGASLPMRLVLDPAMFEVPLDNRIEFIHRKDVALAIANALECEQVWGRTWLIGGGSNCQLFQRELVASVLDAIGIGMLPEEAFPNEPYPTDWLDTIESQEILEFQQRTLQDYLQELRVKIGFRRHLIRFFRPIIRAWLLSKSPVWGSRNA